MYYNVTDGEVLFQDLKLKIYFFFKYLYNLLLFSVHDLFYGTTILNGDSKKNY